MIISVLNNPAFSSNPGLKRLKGVYLTWRGGNHHCLRVTAAGALIMMLMLLVSMMSGTDDPYQYDEVEIEYEEVQRALLPVQSERIVENDDKWPINANDRVSDPVMVPLQNQWGSIYAPNRALCLVRTLWPERKSKMDLIQQTWGQGCTKLMWVVDEASTAPESYAGAEFLSIPMERDDPEENRWELMHRMWATVSESDQLMRSFEWFVKTDDDTFLATENLQGFLQYYDPNYPHYLGHSLRHRWSVDNIIFNSVTYVLSRESLKRVGPYIQHLPTMDPPPGHELCVDRAGDRDDMAMAACLWGVGIRPGNTLDHELRERFLPFREADHLAMRRSETQYWDLRPQGVAEGENCCSPHLISMHNYKDDAEAAKMWPELMKKYNSKKEWNEIILPPRPQLVLWDQQDISFEIDEYLNIQEPPLGSRLYQGPERAWQCHGCDVGNPDDPFWTEWWDKEMARGASSQHAHDPYAPSQGNEGRGRKSRKSRQSSEGLIGRLKHVLGRDKNTRQRNDDRQSPRHHSDPHRRGPDHDLDALQVPFQPSHPERYDDQIDDDDREEEMERDSDRRHRQRMEQGRAESDYYDEEERQAPIKIDQEEPEYDDRDNGRRQRSRRRRFDDRGQDDRDLDEDLNRGRSDRGRYSRDRKSRQYREEDREMQDDRRSRDDRRSGDDRRSRNDRRSSDDRFAMENERDDRFDDRSGRRMPAADDRREYRDNRRSRRDRRSAQSDDRRSPRERRRGRGDNRRDMRSREEQDSRGPNEGDGRSKPRGRRFRRSQSGPSGDVQADFGHHSDGSRGRRQQDVQGRGSADEIRDLSASGSDADPLEDRFDDGPRPEERGLLEDDETAPQGRFLEERGLPDDPFADLEMQHEIGREI